MLKKSLKTGSAAAAIYAAMETNRAASSQTRTLTAAKAFVVHVTSDPGADTTSGRVEHLTSGAAAHFATTAELVGFIHRTLTATTSS